MKKTDKYVYIITCDEPLEVEQELNLFRFCRQHRIFTMRSFLSNQEIVKFIAALKQKIT